jgi:hypothetical protein
MSLPDVRGINFGNPEKHDMEYVLRRCADVGKVFYGGIPRKETSVEEYFLKYLKASKAGERCILLLTNSCKKEEREGIRNAWQHAYSLLYQ